MEFTKEQILKLIAADEHIKKIFDLYRENNLNLISSNYDEEDELIASNNFITAYKDELASFFKKNEIDVNSVSFYNAMEEMGTSDFATSYNNQDAWQNEKGKDPLNDDMSLTDAQRKGLKDFHQWLYRNCDKTGFLGSGNAGSMRDFANNFMKQPAAVQLKALYLLQTGNRKNPDKAGLDDINSQINYVPDLDKIKKPLVANKWKIWRRANGSHLYWEKLSDSLSMAKENEKELVEFRKEITDKILSEDNLSGHRKNGYDSEMYLKAVDKFIDPEGFETEKGEPDEKKKLLFTNVKMLADKIDNMKELSEETRKNARKSIVDIMENVAKFGTDKIKTDSTKTFEGLVDGIDTNLVDHEDDYYDLERAIGAVLRTVRGDKALGEAPTIREMISDSDFAKVPGVAFEGLALISDFASLVDDTKHILSSFRNGGITSGTSKVLDAAADVADIGYRVGEIASKVAEFMDAAEETVDKLDEFSDKAFTGYKVLNTLNSTVKLVNKANGAYHMNKALKNSLDLDKENKQEVAKAAEVISFKNEREAFKAARGVVRGGMGLSLSFASAPIAAVPFLGQAMLAGVIGMGVYEQVKAEKNRRDLARKAVDTLVVGKDRLKTLAGNFKRKLEQKLGFYKKGSAEYKKISGMLANEDKRLDKVRNEEAVKKGNASLFSSTSNVMGALGEDLMKQVYLIDPKKGFEEGNLITKENQKDVYEKHKEKTSFKELLEANGQTVKFKSLKTIQKKGIDKYSEELGKKVTGRML